MFYGKRLTAGLIAVLVAAALVLAGCDNGTTSSPSNNTADDTGFKGTWKYTNSNTYDGITREKRNAQGKYVDSAGTGYDSYSALMQAVSQSDGLLQPAYVSGNSTEVTTATYTFADSTWEQVNTSVNTFTPTNPADANPTYYNTTYTSKFKGTYTTDSDGIAALTFTHHWQDGDTDWSADSSSYTMSAAIIGKKLYIVGEVYNK